MKKLVSLLKASMSSDMNLFKIKSKNAKSKKALPIFLAMLLFFVIWSYANMIMEPLITYHLEFALLTLFILLTSVLTLIEGIYKSGNLLFNCKDDNLLLSLPIKKSTVMFVRVFKFYVFELLYNSLFLIPALIVYARYVSVDYTYWIVSAIGLFLLPIIPMVISYIIGSITSGISSKFKFKNVVQIIITTVFLLGVMYVSFNVKDAINNLAQNASSINDAITKVYYPAGAFIKLVTEFNITDLLIFIGVNIGLFVISIFALSKFYFKINTNLKAVTKKSNNKEYKVKVRKPMRSIINKELKKFINSPVFVTNAGFGLVLFTIACVFICFKFDSLNDVLEHMQIPMTVEQISSNIPLVLFGLICFTSLMTSITSSMISLEGKSFNILKSLPVKPFTIIIAKILTAVLIMIPFILIGDIAMFIKFNFSILQIIIILIESIILPFIAETLGILINLKYPKMNAESDTEVVKQSISSTIAVFAGMLLTAVSVILIFLGMKLNLSVDLTMLCILGIYGIICLAMIIYLNKKSVKDFNAINV